MTYVVCATWKAQPGEAEAVLDLLRQVSRASSAEPGCLLFWVHRSIQDPSVFLLYEQYVSEAAFKAHAASDHVQRFVLEAALPRLESRVREFFELVE
ncbi:MAG: putative quinol monooxygenase [Candidatus Limnocylindrales bacterium]